MKNNMLNTVNPEADVVRARRERTNYRQGQAGQLAGSLEKKAVQSRCRRIKGLMAQMTITSAF